jgi:NDP-sugar pyrophosphorylase family protein
LKAVILAGGEGTRLRPLTLAVPKPVVPIVDRPFLRHQLDMLKAAGIDEVIFSLGYRPERIEAVFGDGRSAGVRIRYVVEASPLGTGGAVKNAEAHLDDLTVVFNGDVLTDVDLADVVRRHREADASATIVLYPVPNPAAYGLVEFDRDHRVRRFLEKPDPSQITTDTINAGIYVLRTSTLSLLPPAVNVSIERRFFPALLARGDLVRAHVHRGYWIDIGTPEKYLQVHRDVLRGRFRVDLDGVAASGGWIHPTARAEGAALEGPFYLGPGCVVAPGATIGPGTTLTEAVTVAAGASVRDSVVWTGTEIAEAASVEGALVAARARIGRSAKVGPGTALGEGAVLPDFTRVG